MSDAVAPEASTPVESAEPPIELPGMADPESPVVAESKGFSVHLVNFEGPFDLLLQLISKHKLDITEIALSQVTDEFIAHIKALGSEWDLDQASEFLLIAATLLDLKAARLLPQGDVEDQEDLALLEARDLLFARLLQYRAFKLIAALMQSRMAEEAKRFPRAVGMEARFADLLPEVLLGVDPAGLAALAARALAPKAAVVPEGVSLAHLHAPTVTVREQAAVIIDRLRAQRSTTFRMLVSDSPDTVTTVCRFLALLELFREAAVTFDQETPLGELTIVWTGTDEGDIAVGDEFDELPAPSDEDGEAPVVPDEPDFLEPGEELTAPDNLPPQPDANHPEPGDNHPEHGDAQPEAGDNHPEHGDAQPEAGEAQPRTADAQPEAGEAQPRTGDAQLEPGNAQPRTADPRDARPRTADAQFEPGDAQSRTADAGDAQLEPGDGQPRAVDAQFGPGDAQPEPGDDGRSELVDKHQREPEDENQPEPETEPGSGPEEHETVEQ